MQLTSKLRPAQLLWSRLVSITILTAYLYFFMEWLFIVTKPSFMDVISLARKVEIFIFTGSCLALVCLLALLPIIVVSRLPGLKQFSNVWLSFGALIPSVVLGGLGLLMVDNFTYTMFKFGIVTSQGIGRGLYAVLLLVLIGAAFREIARMLRASPRSQSEQGAKLPWLNFALGGIVLLGIGVPTALGDVASQVSKFSGGASRQNLPHILLITSDGVEASHMSVYGYSRDTTPRLKELTASSLVAENNFPNSSVTAASIVSIYTGKYPAKVHFYYPPNILRGADAYQHLPGLLRSIGYRTIEIAPPHYVDAVTFNMLDSFDISNGQAIRRSGVFNSISHYLANDFAYFIYETSNRIVDRVRHIFYIKTMVNPIKAVTEPKIYNDAEDIDAALAALSNPNQPVFIHMHLMGTHGSTFLPSRQVFSAGQSTKDQGNWNPDFYDDAILEMDSNVGHLIDVLKKQGLWENTMLILGTDHGQAWTDSHRIPLIIHFPGGEHAGAIQASVQNLDIAPTILDYIGVQKPNWMNGDSLLNPPRQHQVIFSTGPSPTVRGEDGWVIDASKAGPPFYDLGHIDVLYCQKWYRLDLYSKEWTGGDVKGSTDTCPDQSNFTEEKAFQLMISHLKQNGYDTSGIEKYQVK